MNFRNFELQTQPPALAVPTRIVFRAATTAKSVELSAYCDRPDLVTDIIQRLVQQAGGMSVCQVVESSSYSRQLLIGAQLPRISSSDVWQIRAAIERAGAMVERVRVNYQIHLATNSQASPPACNGCRYYHGNSQLICAIHPYGPENDDCRDWAKSLS